MLSHLVKITSCFLLLFFRCWLWETFLCCRVWRSATTNSLFNWFRWCLHTNKTHRRYRLTWDWNTGCQRVALGEMVDRWWGEFVAIRFVSGETRTVYTSFREHSEVRQQTSACYRLVQVS